MTAVGRPDNGQDEGRYVLRMESAAGSAWTADNLDAPLASARPGAGEQQREQILAVLRPVLMERVAQERTDALLALLAHTDEETR